MAMYLIAIPLIFLTFLHSKFKGERSVLVSLLLTFIISLNDGLKEAGINIKFINDLFSDFLPMYNIGLGWVIPTIVGGLCGLIINIVGGKIKDTNANFIRIHK